MKRQSAAAVASCKGARAARQHLERFSHYRQIVGPCFGEFNRSGFAQKQVTAKKGFKAAHMLAYRGLGQVEFTSRQGKRQMTRAGLKRAQPVQGW